MNERTWDWAIVIAAAFLGVAARLGHSWAQRQEIAYKEGRAPRGISLAEGTAALIAAPALGIIAFGLGRYLVMPDAAIAAMAGFAGLAGPSALLALWDRIVDPIINRIRPPEGN